MELISLFHLLNLAIEYNGVWWHCDRIMDRYDNYKKYILCQRKGIRLIQIWECDWISKRSQVESLLMTALGINKKVVYARKCTTVNLNSTEKDLFLSKYHMQGSDKSNFAIGLKVITYLWQ